MTETELEILRLRLRLEVHQAFFAASMSAWQTFRQALRKCVAINSQAFAESIPKS